jgi:hypothetical protein
MKHFLLLALSIFPGFFWAQVVTQAHTYQFAALQGIDMNEDNTALWFYTPNIDSVTLDDSTIIVRKTPNDRKPHAYFLMMDSQNAVLSLTDFYTTKMSVNLSTDRYIKRIDSTYYVSFRYFDDSLFVNDQLYFPDTVAAWNVCIAAFSLKGELIRLKRFPSSASIVLTGFAKNDMGEMYLYGHSSQKTIQFGSFTLPCIGCNLHDSDIFMAKLDSNWNVVNAKRVGSYFYDYSNNMIINDDGALYLTGDYYGSPFEVDGFSLKNQGVTQYSSDAFLLKMDGNLNVQWLKRASSWLLEKGLHLEKAPDGDVYWGVEYISDMVTYEDTTLIGQNQNAFVARVNPQGDLVWIHNFTSNVDLRLNGFSTDDQGSVWTNVFFTGDLTLDGNTVVGQGVEKGYVDNLIVNIGPNGQLNRQYFLGGPDDEQVYTLEVVGNNRLLISGIFFGDTLSFLNMQLPQSKLLGNSTKPTYFYAIMEYPAVGIPELAPVQVHPLRLSPNPCSRQLPLSIQVPVPGPLPAAGTFQVANLQGTVVGSFPPDALTRTATVPPGYLQAGVYVVTYYAEQGMWVGKVVVTD